MSIKIYGDTKGLAASEIKGIERLYRRKVPQNALVTPELAREISGLTSGLNRQIGLMIDRAGIITHVIIGGHNSIMIPDLSQYRRASGRLKGLRCIHTHIGRCDGPNNEDITDLALLRLDAMLVIETIEGGLPGRLFLAHLLAPNPDGRRWEVKVFSHQGAAGLSFLDFIAELEAEIEKASDGYALKKGEELGILVHASHLPRAEAERSLEELTDLARSGGVKVLDRVFQHIERYNPAYLIGTGKLKDILMKGLYLGATIVIFDQDLSPVQVNNIAGLIDLKVLDRTQLILDIFARRAQSKEGKIQVELAQLRYLLPRLVGRGTAMSRLLGGIGVKGPGESKLEMDRRRIKNRIGALERELKTLVKGRLERRKGRKRKGIATVSIIGYTNAGKSTLLNRLTGSDILAEDRLFATLDPSTRRLRLHKGQTALISDTVGFIRNMPKDLKIAFKATLEELEDADLFIHLVDITSPFKEDEIKTVEEVLEEMGLLDTPRVMVFNKTDIAGRDVVEDIFQAQKGAIMISASTGAGIYELIDTIGEMLPHRARHSYSETRLTSS
ncbi:MAG: GTPase HflX [Desulfobacteraceae bacterium]|nr:GTPase HflX [Desulfobacteraceae bacterium]